MTLSVCLIVKNEEDVIERCLECVKKFADEIILVDTGSQDGTVEKSARFTDKIYHFEWIDDFSAARNYAFGQATCDFVMWLDADDVITDENCSKIKKLMEEPVFDVAYLKYVAATEGDLPTFVYYRERIFRRSKNLRFNGAVHEAVSPEGITVYSDVEILHRKTHASEPMRNLRIYQKLISCGKKLDSREKFYYGRELLYNGMYIESIAVLEDFLVNGGWVENEIEACLNLSSAYAATGDERRALDAVLRSFSYAPPRSEACCILGAYFFGKSRLRAAEYWYKCAIANATDGKEGGFINTDYGGFIPLLQLCVIYDRLGDVKRANECNERAGEIKPHSKSYLYNKRYFSEKLGKEV